MAGQHKREAFSPRLRFEVLRRCNFACYYCGVPASLGLKQLHVDHVIPVSLGGTNDFWNLVAACWDCNAGKSNGIPTEELIEAVRSDCCAYRPSTANWSPCRYCKTPVVFECDEEVQEDIDCYTCNRVFFAGVDYGKGREVRW